MKRKSAQEFDRSKPVLLKNVKNFGPVCAAEFASFGVTTLDQLEELGFEESARLWVEHFPERLNANAFVGIIATLDGIVWTKASARQRALAQKMVDLLKRERRL